MNGGKATILIGIGVIATIALIMIFGAHDYSEAGWTLKAQNALVIGGYADNFDYSGTNVRPLIGTATVAVDSYFDTGVVVADVKTTPTSGPIQFAKGESLTGNVRVVLTDFSGEQPYMEGGIAEYLWLHGDTGQGSAVMPRQFTFLAGWGRADIYVNGKLRYQGLEGHFMYTEQARRGPEQGYRVMRDDGSIYSPTLADKTRFTNTTSGELHIIVYSPSSNASDAPETRWLHLNFADVFIKRAPANLNVTISS